MTTLLNLYSLNYSCDQNTHFNIIRVKYYYSIVNVISVCSSSVLLSYPSIGIQTFISSTPGKTTDIPLSTIAEAHIITAGRLIGETVNNVEYFRGFTTIK